MGVKNVFQELKAKVSGSRLFKALVTEPQNVLPKMSNASIKSIDIIQGNTSTPGCVYKTTFVEGGPYKYMKNRIDEVDPTNLVCKFTAIEGDALGERMEKICTELKIEETGDGGCVLKLKTIYHTKGDAQLTDDEINGGKQLVEALYKACEDYLIANPHVCA